MKNICTLIFLIVVGSGIYANPIPLPTIEISELYFDDSGNWKLELGYYDVDQNEFTLDSIFLYSSSGTVKLPAYEYTGSTGVLVITKDSLDTDFIIKRYADTIKVVSYSMEMPYEDMLIFGNIPGAQISYPRQGQSISKYYFYISKDKSPTIGVPNDSLGMCGTLKGVVYDQYSDPVQSRILVLDNNFKTTENGEYRARVYSKPSYFNVIWYRISEYNYHSIPIDQISYVMEPDSTVELDLYLLDSLIAGTRDPEDEIPVRIFPNPVSVNEKLTVITDLPVMTSDVWIEMIDIQGKLIRKERIQGRSTLVPLPAAEGMFIVSVRLDNQVIYSGRILVRND
jgi:hypothetical protein